MRAREAGGGEPCTRVAGVTFPRRADVVRSRTRPRARHPALARRAPRSHDSIGLATMIKDFPDHHDAELVLRMYELRREERMREARAAMTQRFWPRSYEDVAAVMQSDHPMNAAWRQTGSYWEMVYGMARHGVVHPDFMIESNGEGLFLLAKVYPYLEQIRRDGSPRAFRNAEWMATECETGKAMFANTRARVEKALAKSANQ